MTNKHLLSIPVAAALGLAMLFPQPARARVNSLLVVDNDGDANAGACTNAPGDCSLRRALALANPGDLISFFDNYTITLGSPLQVTDDDLTIDTLLRDVRIDANQQGQAMVINASHVQVNGLRMFNAKTGSSNVYIASGKLITLTDNVIGMGEVNESCTQPQSSPNAYGGVYIASPTPLGVGERHAALINNHIACHRGLSDQPGEGVTVSGSQGVLIRSDSIFREIRNNKIGILLTGGASAAELDGLIVRYNEQSGIAMTGAADNVLRNLSVSYNYGPGIALSDADRNLIENSRLFGNDGHGIRLINGSQSNRIELNDLGVYFGADNTIERNQGSGIYVEGSGQNTISRNQIRRSLQHGIFVTGDSPQNTIEGNFIGVNGAFDTAIPNGQHGILLSGSGVSGTVIGAIGLAGTPSFNVIAGNTGDGIHVTNGAQFNTIGSNAIGVNHARIPSASQGNENGIVISVDAHSNRIGGTDDGEHANFIGGNRGHGILLNGTNVAGNIIGSNRIGALPSALARVGESGPTPAISNTLDGIHLTNGARNNTIRAARAALNRNGIQLASAAVDNTIEAVGMIANREAGIVLDGAETTRNSILDSTVQRNGTDGIADRNGATGNRWSQISARANGGLGIDRQATAGTNTITGAPPAPVVRKLSATQVQVVVSSPNATTTELYRAERDPSGYGEGSSYINSTGGGLSSVTLTYTLTVDNANAACFTTLRNPLTGQSSEFSQVTCTSQPVFLPAVLR